MKRLILLLLSFASYIMIAAPVADKTIRIKHFGEDEGFSAALVQHMIQDRQGYIWLATWDGLRRYDGYRFETFKAVPGDKSPLETNRFTYVEEDVTGNIICVSNEIPYLFNIKSRQFEPYQGKKVKTASYQPSQQVKDLVGQVQEFQSSEVNILMTDRQEGVWVYSHRGLERISLVPKVIQPEQTNGESEQVISTLFTDRRGRLWTADKQGYISISNATPHSDQSENAGGGMRWLAPNGSLSSSRIRFGYAAYAIFEDSQRQVWIGAKPSGLFRLTPESSGYRVTHFTHQADDAYSLNSDGVYCIAEDSQHRIILATYGGGLNIGEPQPDGTMRFINCDNRLKQYPQAGLKSRCLWLKDDNTALLGTNDGLYTFSLREPYEKMHFYVNHRQPNRLQSISNNFVMEIRQMRNGDLYLATSGGGTEKILSTQLLSDTIRFQHHSVREGISSDMNQTLAEDMDGNLWIVSAGSVSLLNTRTGIATNYWRLLTEAGNTFTEATPALLPDSSMVLGTANGTLTLRSGQMLKSTFQPPIVFDCEKEVHLSSDERDFTIRFAALDYNKNEEIIYAYRMEGIDSEWRYTRQNELNYASLAPGTYILHIKSTNGDGVWTDNETTITLHRAASFHETPWAWMLYGGLAALLLIIVVSTVRYIRMLKRELKDVQLTSKEQIEVLGARLKELLPITENVKEIHEEAAEQLTADDRQFAERLKKFVEGNLNNADLSVQDMASEMNVSRTVLFVRMKRIFDSSPHNYLLNTRITFAKKLLLEPSARVSDVAYRCGFSDPKYFSRCFKKLTGSLPKDYA